MSDLAIEAATGDLLLIGGKAQLATGAVAVRQAWETHLTLFLGECFRDLSLGIDYQNLILIKNPSWPIIRGIFARASRETPGVAEVRDLRLAFDARARTLTVTASVVYDSGEDDVLTTTTVVGGGS